MVHTSPVPSVFEIDESQYPFNSAYYERETTNGLQIQELVKKVVRVSAESKLSYFELVGGRGQLYENLAAQNPDVGAFVYDTKRSAECKIFFVSQDIKHGVPLALPREAFIELLDKNGVPPGFLEVYVNNNGASTGSPVHSNNEAKDPNGYQIQTKFPTTPFINAAIYFRHDFSTRRTLCIVLGTHLSRLQTRFQQLFPPPPTTTPNRNAASPHAPSDPFLVLSAIAAEYTSILEHERRKLDAMTCEQESRTGITAHHYDESLAVAPSELPSRIKGLHVCDAYLMFFINTVEFQISWVAFLQEHHGIVNEHRRSGSGSGELSAAEVVAGRKVRASLDLSASLLQNMLLQVRTLSRRIQIQISVVQNLIAQADSRTNISIADDSKRIALDAKKDSVAMKTIAGLTMVFLPGTFTAVRFLSFSFSFSFSQPRSLSLPFPTPFSNRFSTPQHHPVLLTLSPSIPANVSDNAIQTLFSMVFFQISDPSSSSPSSPSPPRLSVNSYWWLYIAVTLPLTLLVLAAWVGWLRWKGRRWVEGAREEEKGGG
ncbi:hypothetical protein MMC16_005776 [Acarospora aff. strigata]|nr:hypothetical protein [Acarospora aff. strigata]